MYVSFLVTVVMVVEDLTLPLVTTLFVLIVNFSTSLHSIVGSVRLERLTSTSDFDAE